MNNNALHIGNIGSDNEMRGYPNGLLSGFKAREQAPRRSRLIRENANDTQNDNPFYGCLVRKASERNGHFNG